LWRRKLNLSGNAGGRQEPNNNVPKGKRCRYKGTKREWFKAEQHHNDIKTHHEKKENLVIETDGKGV